MLDMPRLQRLLLTSSTALFLITGCAGGSDDTSTASSAALTGSEPAVDPGVPTADTPPGTTSNGPTNTDQQAPAAAKPDSTNDLATGTSATTVLPAPVKPTPGGTPAVPTTGDDSKTGDEVNDNDKSGDLDRILGMAAESDTDAIRGFWDFTTTSGPLDILFESITADGRITYFDWDNDDYGEGRDCFVVETRRFTALGNDRYSFDGTVLTMAVVGDKLHVSEVEGVIHTFPMRMSIDTNLLPRCE